MTLNIGLLSKKTGGLTGNLKQYLNSKNHRVKIFTYENLRIDNSLLNKDFYILKSKHLLFFYAAYFLEANGIPVIPNPDIAFKQKNRIEAHYLIKEAGLLAPKIYLGTKQSFIRNVETPHFPYVQKPLMGSGSQGVKLIEKWSDLDDREQAILYMEEFIYGTHLLVYFIGKEIMVFEKTPLTNEHAPVKKVKLTNNIREIVKRWKSTQNLLFGHLDIVIEKATKKIYLVDPGSFPEFDNWSIQSNPTAKIGNLILEKYNEINNDSRKK
jgi:hypothetical protein